MTNSPKKFGEEIKQLRLEKNFGVREFAKMIKKEDGTPISPSYIIDIEKNNRVPSADIIERMAEVLDCDADKLFSLAQKIPPENEKYLKENPALGVLLRKAREADLKWEKLEEIIESEIKKKKHEKNT